MIANSLPHESNDPKNPDIVNAGTCDADFNQLKNTTHTVITVDSFSAATYNYDPRLQLKPEPEKKPKQISGRCRHCGKWQTGLAHHENNVCDKRFKRKK